MLGGTFRSREGKRDAGKEKGLSLPRTGVRRKQQSGKASGQLGPAASTSAQDRGGWQELSDTG